MAKWLFKAHTQALQSDLAAYGWIDLNGQNRLSQNIGRKEITQTKSSTNRKTKILIWNPVLKNKKRNLF